MRFLKNRGEIDGVVVEFIVEVVSFAGNEQGLEGMEGK